MESIRGPLGGVFFALLLVVLPSLPLAAGSVRIVPNPPNPRGPWPLLAPASPSDRILVVAPHIDDEAIAAGGFMADALQRGAQVWVVYLTAGDNNRTSARMYNFTLGPSKDDLLEIGRRRIRESRVAMQRLGVPSENVLLLGYPDRGLKRMLDLPGELIPSPGTGRTTVPYPEALRPGAEHRLASLQGDLRAVLDRVRPTLVFLPVDFDAHSDHSAGGRIVLPLLAEGPEPPRALGYLVHAREFPRPFLPSTRSPLFPPQAQADRPWVIFPLTPAQEQLKGRVLTAYRSQRADPYILLLTNAFIRRNELFLPLALPAP